MNAFGAFSAKGQWFRGNCHTHTTLSDGRCGAAEMVDAYRSRGYDFLVLTDHADCQPDVRNLQRQDFLVMNGIELHPPSNARPRIMQHIIGIGVARDPSPKLVQAGSAASVIRWVKRNGGIPIYGHPYWSGHHVGHMREGRGAFGMEVHNTTTEVVRGLGDSSVHLDQALSQRFHWKVFAVDDTHDVQRDGFRGWIMVKAPRLTRRAIMAAVRKGNFYATCGPEIRSLSVNRNIVRVECSPVREIVWHCVGPCGIRRASAKGPLTHADFDLRSIQARSHYVRLEMSDAAGRKAWSNPIWWNNKRRKWED